MGLSELPAGPHVDPALARIAARERDDGDHLRHEERQERKEPERQSHQSEAGNRRHQADVQDRDDLQQDQVAQTQRLRQGRPEGRGL